MIFPSWTKRLRAMAQRTLTKLWEDELFSLILLAYALLVFICNQCV